MIFLRKNHSTIFSSFYELEEEQFTNYSWAEAYYSLAQNYKQKKEISEENLKKLKA